MADEMAQPDRIEKPPTGEQSREADPRSALAWHDHLQASFKRLAEDPEHLALIEKRGF
ncbi:MAG: hypothetical protein U9R07_16475 [Pseudomonadota bacterium]|nr:hypothetical protein [Pseudomonadota bacterium]